MKKRNAKKGFTIVELVIVIAVIAILAAVLIPTFSNVVEKANESSAAQEARNAYAAYLADFDYVNGADYDEDGTVETEPLKALLVEVKDGVYVEIADGVVKADSNGKYTTATPEADDYILTVEGETVTVELYEAPAAGGQEG